MTPTKFDAFTKALATPTSRRQAIKKTIVAATSAMGVLLGLGRVGNASSKTKSMQQCLPNGQQCVKNSDCCSDNCSTCCGGSYYCCCA